MRKFLILFFVAFVVKANSQCTVLLDFAGVTNGQYPFGSLISDGTFLYGMTNSGGTNNTGTIFKILPSGGGYVKLLDFAPVSSPGGSFPDGSLFFDGTFLYGTTGNGGTTDDGTIFKIMPDGTGYVKLFDFTNTTTGQQPHSSLISDGTFLYGTTYYGGSNNNGAIFKIMPNGSGYLKLLDFATITHGINPSDLISDGTFLYGMGNSGGTKNLGTMFKIMPNGSGFVKLLDFDSINGSYPSGSLIYDGTFLYGTTSRGGVNDLGTIFKIKPDGTNYNKLLDFTGSVNGSLPSGSLISDGIFLYGTTTSGGSNNIGTIFKIMPDGSGYTNLLDFAGTTNGNYPVSSLIYDSSFLYGMTYLGGANNNGVVFKFAMPAGVGEFTDKNKQVLVYPNPTNQILNIESENQRAELKIIDMLGNEIKTEKFSDKTSVDVSDLKKGIYFVSVKTSSGISTQKIIVQR
jgi:uncharacterized repeat protein (TIGR03803 family)